MFEHKHCILSIMNTTFQACMNRLGEGQEAFHVLRELSCGSAICEEHLSAIDLLETMYTHVLRFMQSESSTLRHNIVATEHSSSDIDTESDSDEYDTESDSDEYDTESDSDEYDTESDSNEYDTESDSNEYDTDNEDVEVEKVKQNDKRKNTHHRKNKITFTRTDFTVVSDGPFVQTLRKHKEETLLFCHQKNTLYAMRVKDEHEIETDEYDPHLDHFTTCENDSYKWRVCGTMMSPTAWNTFVPSS